MYSCFPRCLENDELLLSLIVNVSALGTPTSLDALDLERLLRSHFGFGYHLVLKLS